MAASKASSNPSGASRNTQTAGPNRGLAGTNSQSGVATARASASQPSRGILKDQSRVPASSAPTPTSRSMVEQARINNLKDQYTRYGEAYRTIAPPPALPTADTAAQVRNPARVNGALKGMNPNRGLAQVQASIAAPTTIVGQRTPQPTNSRRPASETTAAVRPSVPVPQAGLGSPQVPRAPLYNILGAAAESLYRKGVNPASPLGQIMNAVSGTGETPAQPDLSRNLSDAMRRYGQTAGQAVAGGPPSPGTNQLVQGSLPQGRLTAIQPAQPGIADQIIGAFTTGADRIISAFTPEAPVQPALSQYASGPKVTKDQSRVAQGTVVPAGGSPPSMSGAGPFSINPGDPASQRYATETQVVSQWNRQRPQTVSPITIPGGDLPVASRLSRNPYETSYTRPARGNPLASGGPQTQKQALDALKNAIENVRYNYPQPAGPEGQNVDSLDAPLAETTGPVAPSQNAGQPQSLGELANRYDYEKGRVADAILGLPRQLLDAVLGGSISGDTVRGPRDLERGDKGNRQMLSQLLLQEINRILTSSGAAPVSIAPVQANPNQSQLDLVLNTFR